MSDQSTVPPGTPPPSPPPGGPTHPTPTRPFTDVFDLALSLGAEVARDMARPPKPPRKPINTKPIRSATFSLPKPPPFVIGEGPLYDALPPYPPGLDRSRRAAWRMAHKPIP